MSDGKSATGERKREKGIPTTGVWAVPGPPTHLVTHIKEEWLRSEIRANRELVLPWCRQWSNWGCSGRRIDEGPGESSVLDSTFTLPEQTVSLGDSDYFLFIVISSLKHQFECLLCQASCYILWIQRWLRLHNCTWKA